ncbi:MAG: hypothetical protein CMM50_03150 [Rhodospirillaceae bacterium]|nr:hypothetical protein [Rhodospirillaceae bacterium]
MGTAVGSRPRLGLTRDLNTAIGETPQRTDWPGVFFALSIGVLAAYQQFKLPPVLPLLSENYGYDRLLAGGLMSAYAVAGLLLSIGVGRVLDSARGRWVVGSAFPLFLLGNAVCLAVPEIGTAMLGGRVLEGAGLAVISVAGPALAAQAAAPKDKPLAIALWATWMPIGQAMANLMAVPVLEDAQWTPLWWLAVALTVTIGAWALKRLSRAPAAPTVAAPPRTGTGKPSLSLPVILSSLTFMLWTVQYLAFTTWLPTFLVEERGLSLAEAALSQTISPLVLIPFNLLAGALVARGRSLPWLLAGSLVAQGLVWGIGPFVTGPAGFILLAIWGAAAGITATCLFSLPVALSSGAGASQAFGVLMTGRNVGVLVGPVLLAQALALWTRWSLSAQPFMAFSIVAAMGALWIGRYLRPLR